ncbi:hypothetical protein [Paenibacillus terrigena]|uniref:hypothetical protein n=1 Tax=Paenibacillus terrigena TaxID=369333 RepID=UPI0028D41621|nr:hypothetical protein [Paenibacillus terrigena]
MKPSKNGPFRIALALIILILLTSCQPEPNKEETKEPEKPSEQEHLMYDQPPKPIKYTGNVFHSEQCQFKFNLPTKWKNNFIAIERRGKAIPTAEWETVFVFSPGGKFTQEEAPLLTITRLSRKAYQELRAQDGPIPGTVLKSNESYVWLGILPQSNPYDPNTPEGQKFQSLSIDYLILRSYFVP